VAEIGHCGCGPPLRFVVFSFFVVQQYHSKIAGPATVTSVPIQVWMVYRADRQAFETTDTIVLTDTGSKLICLSEQPLWGHTQGPGGGAGSVDCDNTVACDSYARSALEKAGLTFKEDRDGHPVFTRSRHVAIEVPRWWPLSVWRSVDVPIVGLDHSRLVADKDSTATIIAPTYFIRRTLPPALSNVAGSEETKVPINYDETEGLGSSVRLELVSWVARNPVGVSLVDFSWWAPVKWFVLLVAAVFSDQVKDLVRRLFGALVPRKKTDVASADTGHAAHIGAVDKPGDGSPAGSEPVVGPVPDQPATTGNVTDTQPRAIATPPGATSTPTPPPIPSGNGPVIQN
jgi:hypothetical protein